MNFASDRCVYKLVRDKSWLIFALFVDNLFVAATDNNIIDYLIKILTDKYEITNGPLEQGLGMEITKTGTVVFPSLANGTLKRLQTVSLLSNAQSYLTHLYPKLIDLQNPHGRRFHIP